MNTTMIPQTAVAPPTVTKSPNIPIKQPYWQGYDMYVEAYFANAPLTAEELDAMTDAERRGYEAAARHQADTDTDVYLANTNAYGDYTQAGW